MLRRERFVFVCFLILTSLLFFGCSRGGFKTLSFSEFYSDFVDNTSSWIGKTVKVKAYVYEVESWGENSKLIDLIDPAVIKERRSVILQSMELIKVGPPYPEEGSIIVATIKIEDPKNVDREHFYPLDSMRTGVRTNPIMISFREKSEKEK